MFKSKLFLIILSMLVVVTLILGASVTIYTILDNKTVSADPGQKARDSVEAVKGKKLSSAEVKELTVTVKDIITNLAEKERAVQAGFAFELDNKKAKAEFEDFDSRVRNVVNLTLADLTAEELAGSKGQDKLRSILMNKINGFMTQGKVTQVNIVQLIVQ